ncbi:hypothetical protein GGQ92_001841 [Gracilibacillus halotolerans]|uniref:DUF2157 domain-containing protein n=1 Tax=Gracilibacillus halotolerans TaxID=74386 RepID=A0A841RK21_9BACI|nr:hypothetical protein [Gracilibacillus halotolerans]MBB6513051.1 hypothetical protein [Gracilibacillus halotolerans]
MEKKYTQAERKKIFEEELVKMYQHKYLTDQQAKAIQRMYETYSTSVYGSLENEEKPIPSMSEKDVSLKTKEEPVTTSLESENINQPTTPSISQQQVTKQQIEKPKKPEKSPEKLRERNITWALMIGVIMILISGLVVATSNWDNMTALAKTLSIGLVAGFFFVTSYIAGRFLKIEKTAFAFLVLGSLFLPIVVVSIGFYQLLGQWLSIEGEGKYLLGLITAIICLPLYIRNAIKHQNKLFVWLSYLTSTIAVGFLLAAFYPPIDVFYLGIMLYNGLLLFAYHKYQNREKYALFTKQLPIFAQTNLIISTLLMLIVFENALLYSFNLLLTAVIYLSMIFVYQSRNYHFVFTLLFVYGVYQLVENSFLQSVDFILYAIIGFVYLGLQFYFKDHSFLQKAFQVTSAIISFLAFIYISIQGIILRADEPTITMFIAYLVIAGNFLYLADKTKHHLFRVLSPLFILVAGLQSWRIFHAEWGVSTDFFEIYLFGIGLVMFYYIYYKQATKWFRTIKTTGFIISLVTMSGALFFTMVQFEWLVLSFLLLLSCWTMYLIHTKTNSQFSLWVLNAALAGSLLSLYDVLSDSSAIYGEIFKYPFHFALIGSGMLLISYLWRRKRTSGTFSTSAFAIGQLVYSIGLLLLFVTYFTDNPLHSKYIAPILLIGSIVVYILLTRKTKVNLLYGLVAFMTICLYHSFVVTFEIYDYAAYTYYALLTPVILLAIYETIGRKYQAIQPYYFWLSHIVLPYFSLYTYIAYHFGGDNVAIFPYVLLLPLIIYGYSAMIVKVEWAKKVFLYASFLTIPLLLDVILDYHQLDALHTFSNILNATSIILLIVWFVLPKEWKNRIDFYLIPFILFTIINLNAGASFALFIAISILFTVITLVLLHRRKWDYFNFIPLIVSFYFWSDAPYAEEVIVSILISISLLLMVVGRWKYTHLLTNPEKIEKTSVDMYSIFSLFYIFYTWIVASSIQHDYFIIDLLIDISAPVLLTLLLSQQIHRVQLLVVQRLFKTLALLSSLIIYYTLIGNFNIPTLLEAEFNVLPLLIITILLSKKVWSHHKKVMKQIQLFILLVVAAVLVSDALESNTIYDAIIVGVLSILSLIAGMHYKIKSYFFVGAGVLLLNLMLQTRPFWGNMPWWFYLLIGGITLIGLASFYEWQKQRMDQEGNTLLQARRKKVINVLKEWD